MKLTEQRLRRLIREELKSLNEIGYVPDEQFGGKGSPFKGGIENINFESPGVNDDYQFTIGMYSGGDYKPMTIPNSNELTKIQFGNNRNLFYDKIRELEKEVKQKFRKDTFKTRKEIEKIILNGFKKMKSELL